jgi:hypothetical protein
MDYVKFDQAKVIVREDRYYPRLIREVIEIAKRENSTGTKATTWLKHGKEL